MLRRLLNLPASILPVAVIALGWPADDPPPRTRAQADRIHRNSF